MPDPVAQRLRDNTGFHEAGFPSKGFARSEQRACVGGLCWRRWEPGAAAKSWGTKYEGWIFSGQSAWWGASQLQADRVRPSRVDLAWDYSVPDDYRPEVIRDAVEPHLRQRGIRSKFIDDAGETTLYVGSKHSTRRLCVYRKDWQDKRYARECGPMLRVELRLRDERAEGWWPHWMVGEREALAMGAGHVEEMIGLRVQPDLCEVPMHHVREDLEGREWLDNFLRQYHRTIRALKLEGISIEREADEYAERNQHRRDAERVSKLREKIDQWGLAACLAYDRQVRDEAHFSAFYSEDGINPY